MYLPVVYNAEISAVIFYFLLAYTMLRLYVPELVDTLEPTDEMPTQGGIMQRLQRMSTTVGNVLRGVMTRLKHGVLEPDLVKQLDKEFRGYLRETRANMCCPYLTDAELYARFLKERHPELAADREARFYLVSRHMPYLA